MTLGKRIAILREDAKVTQAQLGNIIGVGHSTISNYESDYSKPDHETLIKLADYFHVSVDYLLGRTDRRYALKPVKIITEGGKTKTISYETDLPLDSDHLREHWAELSHQFQQIVEMGALNEEQATYWVESVKADLQKTIKIVEKKK